MRLYPVYGVVIGLLWTGSLWADPPDWCAQYGRIAFDVAAGRELGITRTTALAEANRIGAGEETRKTFQAIIEALYANPWSPEQARTYFEGACRGR
ncbi:MAG: hypothetical protein LM522_06430 [Candidatus Contendobacter sp.]|nr:hypothetical protein [Candidatus Contendobacter sp.]